MKKDFNEICICLDNAIQNANGKLSLQTKIGTFVNLEKRENGNKIETTITTKGGTIDNHPSAELSSSM